MKMLNKKGQAGDGMSWFIATIIIVIVLLFFIFGSSILASTKDVTTFREKLTGKASFEGDDIFLKKSLFSYVLLGEVEKRQVEENLKKRAELGEFSIDYDETKKEVVYRASL